MIDYSKWDKLEVSSEEEEEFGGSYDEDLEDDEYYEDSDESQDYYYSSDEDEEPCGVCPGCVQDKERGVSSDEAKPSSSKPDCAEEEEEEANGSARGAKRRNEGLKKGFFPPVKKGVPLTADDFKEATDAIERPAREEPQPCGGCPACVEEMEARKQQNSTEKPSTSKPSSLSSSPGSSSPTKKRKGLKKGFFPPVSQGVPASNDYRDDDDDDDDDENSMAEEEDYGEPCGCCPGCLGNQPMTHMVVNQNLKSIANLEQEIQEKLGKQKEEEDLRKKASSFCVPKGPSISVETGIQVLKIVAGYLRSKKCSRCNKPCSDQGPCHVPHPGHMVEDTMTSYVGDKVTATKFCRACGSTFTLIGGYGSQDEPECSGPKWCYENRHHNPYPISDDRRVYHDSIFISTNPNRSLNSQLGDIVGVRGKKVLTLQSQYNEGFSEERFDLEPVLPDLEELNCLDLSVSKLTLTKENVPNLKRLNLRNLPDDCSLNLDLPELRSFTIEYWRPQNEEDFKVFSSMLEGATKLEEFNSYKLWVPSLTLNSNHLEFVNIRRSDSMFALVLWAPCLETLNIIACYSIEELEILNDHPLETELPQDHVPSQFDMDITNSNFSKEQRRLLRAHGRTRMIAGEESYEEVDERADGMEDILRSMMMRAVRENS